MNRESRSDPEPKAPRIQLELLLGLMNHIEAQISLGETRASLLLAAGGASAAAYLGAAQYTDLGSQLGPTGRLLLDGAVVTLTFSIVLALWAVRPAWAVTRFGQTRALKSSDRGIITNFASIAGLKPDEFVNTFQAKSEFELERDLLYSIHGKSLKARTKFTELFLSVSSLALSVIMFALALLTTFSLPEISPGCIAVNLVSGLVSFMDGKVYAGFV